MTKLALVTFTFLSISLTVLARPVPSFYDDEDAAPPTQEQIDNEYAPSLDRDEEVRLRNYEEYINNSIQPDNVNIKVNPQADPFFEAELVEKNKIESEGKQRFFVPNAPQLYSSDDLRFECPRKESVKCKVNDEREATNGNQLALLTSDQSSLEMRLRTLKNAQHSIRIEALEFTGDETGHKIAEILKERNANGVSVQVVIDGFANKGTISKLMYLDMQQVQNENKKNPIVILGGGRGYPTWAAWLLDSGFLHPKQVNMRFHEKMWIIDAEDKVNAVAIIGGRNIANGYLGLGVKPFRDQDVIVKGEIVQDIKNVFDSNFRYHSKLRHARWFERIFAKGLGVLDHLIHWKAEHKKYIPNPEIVNQLNSDEKIAMNTLNFQPRWFPATQQFIKNYPRNGETYIRQAYTKQIDKVTDGIATAKSDDDKEIILANAYFLPPLSEKPDKRNIDILEGMRDAVRTGAHVSVITNSLETNDSKILAFVSRYEYVNYLKINEDNDAIKNGGWLKIYEWGVNSEHNKNLSNFDPTHPAKNFDQGLFHAKFGVFGRKRVIVGSYNLDPRSDHLNSEDVLVFQNEDVAREMANQVMKVDLSMAHEVTMEEAKQFRKLSVKSIIAKIRNFIVFHIEAPLL